MIIFSIKLPFSSSLAVDEEPKNDSLMSNLETNVASFDTMPPSLIGWSTDILPGCWESEWLGLVWPAQLAPGLHHHLVLAAGRQGAEGEAPGEHDPLVPGVTTCQGLHNVYTGHLLALLAPVSAAWMMLVVQPVLTGLTGLYRILSKMSVDTQCVP